MSLRIKNWSKHQHFKDRTPPWIKLYREILDDPDWHDLDGDAAKILVGLWLVASEDESHDGRLPDTRRLSFRLRISEAQLNQSLAKLSHWLVRDDDVVISGRYHGDAPEGETEEERETETEGETNPPKVRKTKAKEQTLRSWLTALDDELAIAATDPIYQWATDTGIPADWIAIAWWVFEARYVEGVKTYTDWRAVFRKACREDWLKVWRMDNRDNRFVLTTAGESAKREMESLR